ncbi:MAG: hypothetical protein LQ342_003183 [Letrouitia transgressa]|nr:MAG: hypothetical protein LQ342_003183 [Letrouitia transgressa]
MEPSIPNLPPMKDLTIDNITENTIRINSQAPDPRLQYVLERLVSHLHDFARETRLTTKEWMQGLEFLTEVGKMCSEVRQEFILLSDILGLSLLVDSIDHPKPPPPATEGSVLGPFHTHSAPHLPSEGSTLSRDANGTPLLFLGVIRSLDGEPLEGVQIDVWETDSSGHYDVQYPDPSAQPDGRGVLRSDGKGEFSFKCIMPVSYPIPHDGPVGKLLGLLHRHPYRPAHVHFIFEKPGWDRLVTALYIRGDPYETSDAVFGVKQSLLVSPTLADGEVARRYGVQEGQEVLRYEFVLVGEKEARELSERRSKEALERLGRKVRLVDGLPVPDVD